MATKKYRIRDIHKGYNTHEKLAKVWKDLNDIGLFKNPIIENDTPLVTIQDPNWRGGSYDWNVYQYEDSVVVMEFNNRNSGGYERAYSLPIKLSEEVSCTGTINLCITNCSKKLDNKIKSIFKKYPEK